MSRSSQMVLARCSLAARLNSGFLNCIRGARSEYFGIRRFNAAGTLEGAEVRGMPAGAVSAGVVGASGLVDSIVCVIAASDYGIMWLDHTLVHVVRPHQLGWIHAHTPTRPAMDRGPALRRPAGGRRPPAGGTQPRGAARCLPHLGP